MTAPTAAEIREAIEARDRRYPDDSIEQKLEEAIDKAFDTIGYIALDEQGRYDFGEAFLSDTWGDLRPSEVDRLAELIVDARQRATVKAYEAIAQEVVVAALTFAAEYPNAPRAEREPVPA